MTRGQQKQIETISKEEPSAPKKAKLAKAGTMAVTAKVCVYNIVLISGFHVAPAKSQWRLGNPDNFDIYK